MAQEKVDKTSTEASTQTPAEPAKTTPSPAPTAPVKKSHTALIVILVLVFLFVVAPIIGVVGFGFWAKGKVNEATKNITVGSGSETVTGGENLSWPSSIPSNVPKFTAGTIKASARSGSDWTLTIANVSRANVNSYKNILTSSGWTVDGETDLGGLYNVSATQSNWRLNIVLTPAESSMVFSVSQENE